MSHSTGWCVCTSSSAARPVPGCACDCPGSSFLLQCRPERSELRLCPASQHSYSSPAGICEEKQWYIPFIFDPTCFCVPPGCISVYLYLLHIGPQDRIRWVVDFLPVDRHINLVIKLHNHQTITQVPVEKQTRRQTETKSTHNPYPES